jgi:hypothetical protein
MPNLLPDPYAPPNASLGDRAHDPRSPRSIAARIAWFAGFAVAWFVLGVAFRIGSDVLYLKAFLGNALAGVSLPLGLGFPEIRVVSLFLLSPVLLGVAWGVNRLFRACGPVEFLVATAVFFAAFYQTDFVVLAPVRGHAVVFIAGMALALSLAHPWRRRAPLALPPVELGAPLA